MNDLWWWWPCHYGGITTSIRSMSMMYWMSNDASRMALSIWWVSTTMMHQFYWFQLRNIRMASLRFEAENLDSACSAIKLKRISFGGDALEDTILYRIFLPGDIAQTLIKRTTHWHGAHFITWNINLDINVLFKKSASLLQVCTALEFFSVVSQSVFFMTPILCRPFV